MATFLLTACSSLPENTSKPSYSLEKSVNTRLEKKIIKTNRENGLQDDADTMLLLDDGNDALVARLSLINSAQYSVDLQYYLYHSDLSGHLIAVALWEAAEKGVRIRLLLDDMTAGDKDEILAKLNSHPNINIRLFNPFIRGKSRAPQFVSQFGSITRRMHNKSLTADSSVSILGGRNVGDVYFDADEHVAFDDLDVALTGRVVQRVSQSFDEYWNSHLSYPVELLSNYELDDDALRDLPSIFRLELESEHEQRYVKALKENNLVQLIERDEVKVYTGKARVLVDNPDKIVTAREQKEYHLNSQLEPYINNVKKELIIVSPYFVPEKQDIKYFEDIIDRGVKVKILTNSLMSNDVTLVHAGYCKYRKKLLSIGVQLYEMDSKQFNSEGVNDKQISLNEKISKLKVSLHAKYFIIDRHSTFIGSMNFDPRSMNENTEIGVIIEATELSQDVARRFDNMINSVAFELSLQEGDIIWSKVTPQKTVTYDSDPYSNFWERLVVSFMSYFPGESQL